MEVKKYDFICSIGEDCACTSYLKNFNLRTTSSPFDWLTKADFETRINLIINNFENFLNIEDLKLLQKDINIENDNKCDYYHNIKTNFYFYHDFPINIKLEQSFQDVKEKYNRRIERFYYNINNNKNILFIWWSRDKIISNDILINSYNKLQNKFKLNNINLLIFENNFDKCDIEYNHINDNILKVISNFAFYKNEKDITIGNKIQSNKVFSQIKLKIILWKYILNNIIKYFCYIFCSILFFNKQLRRSIRSKLINKLNIK